MTVIISILKAAKSIFAAEFLNSFLNKYFYTFVSKIFLLFAKLKIKKYIGEYSGFKTKSGWSMNDREGVICTP